MPNKDVKRHVLPRDRENLGVSARMTKENDPRPKLAVPIH